MASNNGKPDPRIERCEDFIQRIHSFEIVINKQGQNAFYKGATPIDIGKLNANDLLTKSVTELSKKKQSEAPFSQFLSEWITFYEACKGRIGDIRPIFLATFTNRELALEGLSKEIAIGFVKGYFEEGQSLTKTIKDLQDERAKLYLETSDLNEKLTRDDMEKVDLQNRMSSMFSVCPRCHFTGTLQGDLSSPEKREED